MDFLSTITCAAYMLVMATVSLGASIPALIFWFADLVMSRLFITAAFVVMWANKEFQQELNKLYPPE